MNSKLITKRTTRKTEQLITIPRGFMRRKQLVWKYGDFQAAVAKSLGVTTSAVNQVWQGTSSTPRIVTAILEELNKRIAEQQKSDAA